MRAALRDWLEVTRPFVSAVGAAYTFAGAYLGAGVSGLESSPVLRAAVTVAFVVAFGFVYNDYGDRKADRIRWPQRPMASGRIGVRGARTGAAILVAAALFAGCFSGKNLALFSLLNIVVAAAYTLWLKSTLLVGNFTMGYLNGSVLLYGAMAAGQYSAAVWYAAGLAFVYSTAQEILYSLDDEHADRVAGQSTTAVRLGTQRTLRLFQIAILLTCGLAAVPWLIGRASQTYLIAVLAGLVAPNLAVLYRMGNCPSSQALGQARYLSRIVRLYSLVPILLLR